MNYKKYVKKVGVSVGSYLAAFARNVVAAAVGATVGVVAGGLMLTDIFLRNGLLVRKPIMPNEDF